MSIFILVILSINVRSARQFMGKTVGAVTWKK